MRRGLVGRQRETFCLLGFVAFGTANQSVRMCSLEGGKRVKREMPQVERIEGNRRNPVLGNQMVDKVKPSRVAMPAFARVDYSRPNAPSIIQNAERWDTDEDKVAAAGLATERTK